MSPQRPVPGGMSFGGFSGPVPRDIWILLGTLFATFTLRFFTATAILPALLSLTPGVWQRGFLWQLATYPFVGHGEPGIWFLLELLILFWFSRDVYARLGRRSFWLLIAAASISAAVVAVLVQLLGYFVPALASPLPFTLIQGQRMLMVISIAAFAVLYRHATILLFFVLPVQAKWFLWIEILFGFMGFLASRDLAGFMGLCVAVAVTYNLMSSGGLSRALRELRLRAERLRIERKLRRMREKRGFRVVRGDSSKPDDWIN